MFFSKFLMQKSKRSLLKESSFFWEKYKVRLIRSVQRTRSISVGIDINNYSQKALIVRCPSNYSLTEIVAFLNNKRIQINKLKRSARPPAPLRQGSQIFFKGKKHTLNIIPIPPPRPPQLNAKTKCITTQLIFSPQEIILYLSNNPPQNKIPPISKDLLTKFFKTEARQYLTECTDYWCRKMDLQYNKIRLKDTKTLWGSCSSKGNLNYKWQIIMAPLPIINYLVIHEVSHLKQGNHSAKFWNLVQQYDPQYKEHRRWLREEGWKLRF